MKILYIINNINRGGAETLLLNIIKYLTQKDSSFVFKVLLLEDKQYLRPLFDKEMIDVESVDCKEYPFLKQTFALKNKIKEFNPDIVHTHLLESDRVGLFAAFLAGVKIRICTIHNMEPNRDRRDVITRFFTSVFATRLIAVSESARSFCSEKRLYPKKKMEVIYNAAGFVKENVTPKPYPEAPFEVVNIARLHEQKGQKYLIEAMKILQDKGISAHLTIYGAGALHDELKTQVEDLKLKNTTVFGITDDVPEVLSNAHIFVAPSLWEGLPLSQIEAAMMGVPIVATSIEPHKEVFNFNGTYPYLVEPQSPTEIASKIIEIINLNPNEFEELSKKILSLSKRFSMDEMINSYYRFYKREENV